MDFRSYLITYIILLSLQSHFSNTQQESWVDWDKHLFSRTPCPSNLLNHHCRCLVSPNDGVIEYECEIEGENQFILDLKPPNYFHIVGGLDVNTSIYDLLPNFHEYDKFESAIFQTCPLNETITFQDILNKMGVKSVDVLRYASYGQFPEILFTRKIFSGLNLTKLYLVNNFDRLKFDPEVFYDLESLEYLNLFENDVKLTSDLFHRNKKLRFLELGSNDLMELPERIFSGLTKLEILNLERNKIYNLTSEFDDLNNLLALNLNDNNLTTLSETVFSKLVKLQNITLNGNYFKYLPGDLFQNNKELDYISFGDNSDYVQFGPGLFSNLTNLKFVVIKDGNVVGKVPEDLFWNSSNITNLTLSGNPELDVLPELIFRDLINLQSLDLSFNILKTLSENLFNNTVDLHTLDLSSNQLKIISNDQFSKLINLKELHLENNKIFLIGLDSFKRTINLEAIYLRNNELSYISGGSKLSAEAVSSLKKLKILDLSNNSISAILDTWKISLTNLRLLNLSYNDIPKVEFIPDFLFVSKPLTVDLRHNKIQLVDMKTANYSNLNDSQSLDAISSTRLPVTVLLGHNPIVCDCQVFHLLRYLEGKLDPEIRALVEINVDNLKCNSPTEYQDTQISTIPSNYVYCPFRTNCPEKCSCSGRFSDESAVVNCSKRGLTELPPRLPKTKLFKNIILDISHNRIPAFEINETLANVTGYQDLTELYVSHNNMSTLTWISPGLQVLDMHSNKFETINVTLLRSVPSLKLLTLYGNPWQCDCINLDLLSYIQEDLKRLPHAVRILCDERQPLTNMTSDELCPFPLKAIISLSVFFVVLSSLVTILLIVYYRNEHEIKVWLYAHNCCLWWIGEDELDKDKKYDAFISYSYKDRDFVVKELVPNLEQYGDKKFKLCIDERDWIAGETIPNQIAKSVLNSRRTVVVLSPNFLESVWGKMEFRSAHRTALEDGQARVIVIKLAEIGDLENIDPELRAYLTMNTYISWTEKNFWNKLRYALPHPPKLSKRAALISQHIHKSLNDKSELIKTSQTITSTPPAESIDKDPLMYKNGVTNPLALQIQIGENKIIV